MQLPAAAAPSRRQGRNLVFGLLILSLAAPIWFSGSFCAFGFSSDSYLNQAEQLAQEVENLNSRIQELRSEIAKRANEANALASEKIRALAEMRDGFFCSGCGQTRTQILAKGEQFPHPGQHIVAATGKQLEAKAQEFDQKIASVRQDAQNLAKQADQLDVQRSDIVTNRLPRAVLDWRDAIIADEEELRRSCEAENQQLQRRAEQLGTQLAATSAPGDIAQIMTQYNDLQQEWETAQKTSRRQADLLESNKKTGLAELDKALSRAGAPFLIPPMYMLPTFTLDTKFTPLELKVSPNSLVLTAKFGTGLKAVLETRSDFFTSSMSVKMGLESFGFSGGMQRTTSFGPDGVTTTENPFFKTPFSPPSSSPYTNPN